MVDIQVPQAKQANNQIRVLIVDDHAILRDSMRALFDSYSDIKIIGEASDSGQALDKVQDQAYCQTKPEDQGAGTDAILRP
jgi:CheY-like chemotaxis protein